MEPNRPVEPLNEASRICIEVQVEVNQQYVIVSACKYVVFYLIKDFSSKKSPQRNLPRTVEPELVAGTLFNNY